MAAQLSVGKVFPRAALTNNASLFQIVETTSGDWYFITIASSVGTNTSKVVVSKSTDRGRVWQTFIAGTTTLTNTGVIEVWCDWWTNGDTGTLIHIVTADATTDDVIYLNYDTSTDTASSQTTVFTGVSFTANSSYISITKTVAGNLHVAFDGDAGTETGHYVAASPFTTWTSKASPTEAGDWMRAFPGDYADTDDYDIIFLDRSANGLSLKTYDASGDSWSEAAIASDGAINDATTYGWFYSAAQRHSDNHLIVCCWNGADSASADLLCWDVYGSGSITAQTNVVTNSDDCVGCSVMIDQSNDRIYVFYMGKDDGSQTAGTALGVYYKYSDDGGSTWSSEQTLWDTFLRDWRYIHTPPTVDSVSVALPIAFYENVFGDVYTTAENPDTGGGGTSGGWWGS